MNYTAENLSAICEILKQNNCDVLTDSELSKHSTFKVGGKADLVVLPENTDALCFAVKTLNENSIPCLLIGNGSNILFSDSGFSGAVIKTTSLDPEIRVDGTKINCSAGTSLAKLCTAALDSKLTGLEFAFGIPGTVGGAVYMNAGAYGGEIKDVLKSVTHFNTETSEIQTVPTSELELSYRHSVYSENKKLIILSAGFELQNGNSADIKDRMNELMSRRKDKQPLDYPSAGSTFKRPEGHFAGALIEQCNLKGYEVGGAQVSEKHAGFVINKNNATAEDILSLIEEVKKIVKEKTGITLEPEVKIIP